MTIHRTVLLPKMAAACFAAFIAAPVCASPPPVAAPSYWQQIVALFSRWGGTDVNQNCVPSEVDTCGIQEPQ